MQTPCRLKYIHLKPKITTFRRPAVGLRFHQNSWRSFASWAENLHLITTLLPAKCVRSSALAAFDGSGQSDRLGLSKVVGKLVISDYL